VQGGLVSTGFQTLNWLTVFLEELAPSQGAMPRLVVVTDQSRGEVVLALPLLVSRRRHLKVARIADLGVAEYGAPILGRAELRKERSMRRVWRAIRRALKDIDLIRLERMPGSIGGRANPLVGRAGTTPSRFYGRSIHVPHTVGEYLDGLDKERRKEIERRYRVWEKEGGSRFYCAETPEQIARVFSVLEDLELERHHALGRKYQFNKPAYRTFYERLAIDGSEAGLVKVFALEARGEIVATLIGICHGTTFTVLRRSDLGSVCKHFSPGRLILFEVMSYLRPRGIRRFDLGCSDDAFRGSFAADDVPLYDLVVARHLGAVPAALYHWARGRMRKTWPLRAVFYGSNRAPVR
jgi:CelD/BcsL family acetyltransferase involved in cellulose biosynthesis